MSEHPRFHDNVIDQFERVKKDLITLQIGKFTKNVSLLKFSLHASDLEKKFITLFLFVKHYLILFVGRGKEQYHELSLYGFNTE